MRTDGRWLRHSSSLVSLIIVLVLAVVVSSTKAIPQGAASSAQAQANHVSIGPSDIGGVVTSAKGPEAGVWVIAETSDLPTKYRKIVVTDDAGRYLLPELPKACLLYTSRCV